MISEKAEFPDDEATDAGDVKSHDERQKRKRKAEALTRPDSPTVYEVIARDGIEEMERPLSSLWWSGVAAGFGISISLFVMAALRASLGDAPGAAVIEKFGYSVGFIVVILGRLQLFTENTITPVLPVLRARTGTALWCMTRLWTVVFAANIVGTFLSASLPFIFPIGSPEVGQAALDISMHFASRSAPQAFFTGVPAGFLVAALVWMLPSSKGFEFWTILVMTFAIAIAGTSHVIVGSTELFTALLHDRISLGHLLTILASTAAGNILGGSGLFALLAYAQVSEEI